MIYDQKLQDIQTKRTSIHNPDLINQSKKYKAENHLKTNVGLAQRDPLAFIETVLAHHAWDYQHENKKEKKSSPANKTILINKVKLLNLFKITI